VVGQPNVPATFTPGEIPGTHFQRLSRPQSTWFCWGEPRKKSPVTPSGIDPGTVQLVAQCLNHYATPGPMALVSSANNTVSDTEFILRGRAFMNIMNNRGSRIDPWGTPCSMYLDQRNNFELYYVILLQPSLFH